MYTVAICTAIQDFTHILARLKPSKCALYYLFLLHIFFHIFSCVMRPSPKCLVALRRRIQILCTSSREKERERDRRRRRRQKNAEKSPRKAQKSSKFSRQTKGDTELCYRCFQQIRFEYFLMHEHSLSWCAIPIKR